MPNSELSWTTQTRGPAHVASPSGRVDESTASDFAERLAAEVEAAKAAGATRLVVDMAGVAYMSSRGLRGLTLTQRKGTEAGVTIVLARPNEIMREILAISRYDKVFKVIDGLDPA